MSEDSILLAMTIAIGEAYDGYADPKETPNNWGRAEAAARDAWEAAKRAGASARMKEAQK